VTLSHLRVLVGQVGAAVLVNTVVSQVSVDIGKGAEIKRLKNVIINVLKNKAMIRLFIG